MGWPEYAPYDAIIVTAGGPQIPQPLKIHIENVNLGAQAAETLL